MQSPRGTGCCEARGSTKGALQGAQRLHRLALGTVVSHPGVQFSGAVAAAGSLGRQARTPAQPLPRRDSPRAPGLWTVRLGTSRLPQTHLCSASPREYPSAPQQPQKRHSSPQARLGAALSPAARPRPPNSRPFLGDRPAESSARSRRAEAAPLAMLGTGSQLPREPQKEKGV